MVVRPLSFSAPEPDVELDLEIDVDVEVAFSGLLDSHADATERNERIELEHIDLEGIEPVGYEPTQPGGRSAPVRFARASTPPDDDPPPDDPATVRFTRPYDKLEIVEHVEPAREPARELSAPRNLVEPTSTVRRAASRRRRRRSAGLWRWAVAGLILGAAAFAGGLGLAHLAM